MIFKSKKTIKYDLIILFSLFYLKLYKSKIFLFVRHEMQNIN
jgi:hypothetical protein